MKPGLGLIDSMLRSQISRVSSPRFVIESDPWHKTFLRNLGDLFRPRERAPLSITIAPGQFWSDVFVKSALPWRRFVESVILHGAAIVLLGNVAQFQLQRPHLTRPARLQTSGVITYSAAEYLPPLDTGRSSASVPQSGDPIYAPQPIISVPPESDNRQQTIVTPPALKLDTEVALPNIIAWQHPAPSIAAPVISSRTSEMRLPASPAVPIAPPPAVSRSMANPAPFLASTVVAPAPSVSADNSRNLVMPQPAVVGPPPGIEIAALRKVGDINVGAAQVVAPAPQLPVAEQHTLPNATSSGFSDAAVVPPPASLPETSGTHSDGRVIALSVHPAPPSAAVAVPTGNRRGSFAASPEGQATASGAPGTMSSTRSDKHGAEFPSGKDVNGVPPGLFVASRPDPSSNSPGTGSSSASDPVSDPPLVARLAAPRAVAARLSPEQENETERQVFGVRTSYSMTLNVPNLNSAGGSLILHFSELSEGRTQGDLFAPVITRAVAPGYPLELMRENVQGIVELSAVIHSDGSVSDIRVLNDADDRLQAYAREALVRWQFLPALRNGKPVPLQAVVRIPFKPRAVRGF
jgi:TonB family protein